MPMEWQRITAMVIVAVVVLVLLYDLIAYTLGGNAATISSVCLRVEQASPGWTVLCAFAAGLLFGHLFLPQATR